MIAMFGAQAVLLIGVIAACVARRYYCKSRDENNDSGEPNEIETPLIHIIKISHPHRGQLSNDTFSNVYDSKRNSIDSNGAMEMKQLVQEAEPGFLGRSTNCFCETTPRTTQNINENFVVRTEKPAGEYHKLLFGSVWWKYDSDASLDRSKPRASASSSHEAPGMPESNSFRII